MPAVCPNCGVTDTETDDRLGHTVCTNCGGVIQENTIVAEVTFSENAKGAAIADGFQLGADQARAIHKGSFGWIRSGGQNSREMTLQNGHRRIHEIANQPQIRMNERFVEVAQRFFNLAVMNGFTRGRKSNNVIAACLYIVCRMEKTAHMLIDFADALSTNVYQLGATFLALCKVAGVTNLPLVDPSLYIARFAAKLDFEDKTQLVIKDANRLVQRMSRDWIQTGRRPSGICAASLFIAARMHGFNRLIKEIVMVVKICQNTLRSRLKEFQNTPSGNLSVADFQTIWLEQEKDPPAFNLSKPTKSDPSDEKPLNNTPKDSQEYNTYNNDDGLDEYGSDCIDDYGTQDVDEANLLLETENILEKEQDILGEYYLMDSVDDDTLMGTYGTELESRRAAGMLEERLSDLDDDEEVNAMIDVTPEEVEFKNMVWSEENKDWLVQQEQKRLREANGESKKKPVKKKQKTNRDVASSPAEAAKNLFMSKPTLSKKINYSVLETLFEEQQIVSNKVAESTA